MHSSQNVPIVEVEELDDLELAAVGYRREMPRQFSVLSLGALSFTLTCTWLGTGSSIGTSLTEASAAGTIWSLPIAALMTIIVSTGMAELASAYPVAGAQYYWSFMVARDDWKPFAAYLNGWISILGWWLASGAVSNFVSSMILSIVNVWYPDFESKHWQQWLIYVALIWTATGLNVFGHGLIPLFNKFILFLSIIVLSSTTVALFACSRHHHASAEWTFKDTTNSTGWASDGFAFVLSVCNAVFAFLGSDAGAHLCEEIHNPGRNVPKVILVPLVVGFLTAFPFAIACVYSITNFEAVLSTPSGLPLIEIYRQGLGSDAGATVLMAMFAFCFFGCLVGNATTSSRTLWAVSRDGALPYSKHWKRVNRTFKMPMNAMILSACCVTLYGLIFLGSTTTFSSMVNACIVFLQTSCVVPQAILLWRGRERVLPRRYFSLGIYGTAINSISVAWVVALDVLYCFPTSMPVTPASMSYVSVVAVGLVLFVTGLWMTSKRHVFTGPKINEEELVRRRNAAMNILEGHETESDGFGGKIGTTITEESER